MAETALQTTDENCTNCPDPTEDEKRIPWHKGITLDDVYKYRSEKGLTFQEIADLLGCSKSAIIWHCKRHNILPPEKHKNFDSRQVVKLQSKADLILNQLTVEKAEKARITELTTGYGTLLDKLQLLLGRATERIDMTTLDLSLEDIRREKAKLLDNDSGNDQ